MARKDVNSYFSHDSNARNDDKLIRLRMKHGAAGYGVYFMILERLREETDYVSIKDYNIIAFDFRVDSALVKSVVEDFGLFVFTEDGKGFYSESFLRRMEKKDSVINKRKDAAAARWGKRSDTSQSEDLKTEKPSQIPNEKKETKQKPKPVPTPSTPVPPAPSVQKYSSSIDVEVAEMKKSAQWKESVCIRYQLTNEQVDNYLADFALKCDKQHTSMQDARSHFCYWLQKQKKEESQTKPPTDNDYKFTGGFGGVDI